MSEHANASGLSETDIEEAVGFADAAQYLAGGHADERSRELGREVLRGNLTHRQAVDDYLAQYKDNGQR
ncbi:hypothetical protein [Arthrobacter sp. NPDC056727]|uniref:hypothetical protein n=1 Tax=Arthrobacter sp. NPDC056727 TaxID=3345927 RepID=UPI00366AA74C